MNKKGDNMEYDFGTTLFDKIVDFENTLREQKKTKKGEKRMKKHITTEYYIEVEELGDAIKINGDEEIKKIDVVGWTRSKEEANDKKHIQTIMITTEK